MQKKLSYYDNKGKLEKGACMSEFDGKMFKAIILNGIQCSLGVKLLIYTDLLKLSNLGPMKQTCVALLIRVTVRKRSTEFVVQQSMNL